MTILANQQQQAAWNEQWQTFANQQQQAAWQAEAQWQTQQKIAETAGCADYQSYLRHMGIGQGCGSGQGQGESITSAPLGKGVAKPSPVALYPALSKGVGKGSVQGKGSMGSDLGNGGVPPASHAQSVAQQEWSL